MGTHKNCVFLWPKMVLYQEVDGKNITYIILSK